MNSGFLIAGSPTGPQGSGSESISKNYNIVVPANSSAVIDAISFTNFVSAKWLVTVVDQTNSLMQTYEAVGQLSTIVSPSLVRFSTIGANIDNILTFAINNIGPTAELTLTNQSNVTLTIHLARYNLSI